MEVIAKRLKIARTQKGFQSCRKFALRFGFCPRKYQRHEAGKNKLDFETLIEYCKALNISLLWFQTGNEHYLGVSYDCK